MKLLHVVGARPNFIKAGPVHAACARLGASQLVVHTGQHYDERMSAVFFEELGLPTPDINLQVGSGTHAEQTADVMLRLEPIVIDAQPDWVVVYGDVNSTVASALVCAKLGIRVAHVEAGLRSFDRAMPEEINRVITDQLADMLLTPSADANDNLAREGIPPERVRLVGNVMIDTLVACLPAARARFAHASWPDRFILLTLHRPSNVDDNDLLARVLSWVADVSGSIPVVFPVHPRTRERLARQPELESLTRGPNIHLVEPLGYLDFLALQDAAVVVVTDSGGIQEETTFLGVPCVTLRENTERPVTVSIGTNTLVGHDYGELERTVLRILEGDRKLGEIPPLWDGKTGDRIARQLMVTAVPPLPDDDGSP